MGEGRGALGAREHWMCVGVDARERESEIFNKNGEWLSRFAGIHRESSGDGLKEEQIPLCLRGEI